MIFCVEDDSNIRELVIYTLETTGFKARGCSIAFQDEKRADFENKAGLCEKCQIFWKKLFCSGGKSPSGNEEWYDHAFKTGKGVGNRWKSGVCAA